jgi:hypothetical protein
MSSVLLLNDSISVHFLQSTLKMDFIFNEHKVKYGVNLTNLMAQSAMHRWSLSGVFGAVQFHQQNYAQLYQYARKYAQLLRSTPYAVRQYDWHKPTCAKYAGRMLVKLTYGRDVEEGKTNSKP